MSSTTAECERCRDGDLNNHWDHRTKVTFQTMYDRVKFLLENKQKKDLQGWKKELQGAMRELLAKHIGDSLYSAYRKLKSYQFGFSSRTRNWSTNCQDKSCFRRFKSLPPKRWPGRAKSFQMGLQRKLYRLPCKQTEFVERRRYSRVFRGSREWRTIYRGLGKSARPRWTQISACKGRGRCVQKAYLYVLVAVYSTANGCWQNTQWNIQADP